MRTGALGVKEDLEKFYYKNRKALKVRITKAGEKLWSLIAFMTAFIIPLIVWIHTCEPDLRFFTSIIIGCFPYGSRAYSSKLWRT